MVKTVCHFYFSRKERRIEENRVPKCEMDLESNRFFVSRMDLDSVLSRANKK